LDIPYSNENKGRINMDRKNLLIFENTLDFVAPKVAAVLSQLPNQIKANVQEIRLKTGKSVSLTIKGKTYFVTPFSSVSDRCIGALKVDKKDMEDTFRLLCRNSVYSHINEIKEGYISLPFGCRAGLGGTYSKEGGITGVSSVNIRIAKEVTGCADGLSRLFGGVLFLGPAGSGKTTLLRDYIRLLSDGKTGEYKRVSVIDTRGELSAVYNGISYNNLGENTDILHAFPKGIGIENALRTLYPDYIAFDEMGYEEYSAIEKCIYSGVDIITSAHLGNKNEIPNKEHLRKLIKSGAVKNIVMLSCPAGSGYEILSADEVIKNCGL
jgi:stage III sporulation protein AA